MQALKDELCLTFDHTMLIAVDDPMTKDERILKQYADVHIVDAVGCEAFAKIAFNMAHWRLPEEFIARGGRVVSVRVQEHEGNTAIYRGDEWPDLKTN